MKPLLLAERLTLALDAVASALAAADVEGLLVAEEQLSLALAEMAQVRTVDPDDRAQVARQLLRARGTLARCRVLGQSAYDATQAVLLTLGRSPDYARSGARVPAVDDALARGSALRMRM
jgi:hypothetical protein